MLLNIQVKIIFNNSIYEAHNTTLEAISEESQIEIAKYANDIRVLVYKAIYDKVLKPNRRTLLSDLGKRYQYPIDKNISDLSIYFANGDGYYYDDKQKMIILPQSILIRGLGKKDSIAISHELEHYFQYKNGTFKDQGTYTNKNNIGSELAYHNDINEINARISQISSFLTNSPKFKEEVSEYDFEPFVETIIQKVLHTEDVSNYLDNILSEDNRNKLLEYLFLTWKKIKK